MWHPDGVYLGMHLIWWLFWIVLLIVVFGVLVPTPRSSRRTTALEILQRRYAAGELTTQEYEERRARIERDVPLAREGVNADQQQKAAS